MASVQRDQYEAVAIVGMGKEPNSNCGKTETETFEKDAVGLVVSATAPTFGTFCVTR